MPSVRPVLPYFDELFARLVAEPDADIVRIFGQRHVHWGYYDDPLTSDTSTSTFAQAAERLTEKLISLAGVRNGQQILDVGCGIGGTLAHINERFSDMLLAGANIEARQLLHAQRLSDRRASNALEYVAGNAIALPFAANVFDCVLAVECIFHFPGRRAFFREAARVLKPGGCLVLSDFVPEGRHLLDLGISALSRLGNISGFYGTFNWWPPCTLTGYRWLARQSGLRLTAMEDVTRNTLPTYVALLSMLKKMDHAAAIASTAYVEKVSRAGWVRYLNLRFEVEK